VARDAGSRPTGGESRKKEGSRIQKKPSGPFNRKARAKARCLYKHQGVQMNKLVLAATVALAMGGYAMAQCGDLPPAARVCNPLVYDFNVNLKTTIAKPGKVVKIKNPCGDDPTVIDPECFRVKGSRALKGFIASCDCWCAPNAAIPEFPGVQAEMDDGQGNMIPAVDENGDPIWVTGQEPRPAVPAGTFIEFNEDRWTVFLGENKTRNVYADLDDFVWDAFWRIGKNNTDLETAWNFASENASLAGMGWGKVNKAGIATAMNGNVLGWLEAPTYFSKTICCEDGAFPFNFCSFDVEDVDTIAFGTWKMKYNAKASAASKATGALPFPKWY
jgi:hypothetical protein